MPTVHTADHPLRLCVLLSGAGTTLQNLIERIADGRLRNVRIVRVISSRSTVGGVRIARQAGIPVAVVRVRDHASPDDFSQALSRRVDECRPHVVLMAGFLCHWQVPGQYVHRVLNLHPALLPDFGGRGMFGIHVHAAVLGAGRRESGCTVHLVDQEYDHGPIVARATLQLDPSRETPDSLAARVQTLERELLPEVLQCVADGGVEWLQRFA